MQNDYDINDIDISFDKQSKGNDIVYSKSSIKDVNSLDEIDAAAP
jgi:hypothetical protein